MMNTTTFSRCMGVTERLRRTMRELRELRGGIPYWYRYFTGHIIRNAFSELPDKGTRSSFFLSEAESKGMSKKEGVAVYFT